ncbi:MAG: N-formylglutamate amidohydrolase [Patescibacteria group bacterium]|jgi:N-formylglutamate amidohydrolase
MPESSEHFPYIQEGQEAREREPVSVVNAFQERGLPSREDQRVVEITGEQSVVEHLEPLQAQNAPNVLYGVPHGGELVPKDLHDRMTEEGRETSVMIDLNTPDIFRSERIPSVETKISRYIVDPNRAPDFRPEEAFEPGKAPGKILWKTGANMGPMYEREPSADEIQEYAKKFYLPYYNRMMGTVGTMLDRRASPSERVLILDGHSFPVVEDLRKYYQHYGIDQPELLPMFILGDRDGEGCDPDIMQRFRVGLERGFQELSEQDQALLQRSMKGPLVSQNEFLKGVHNVAFWGARDQGANAIQIEMNESAYVDRQGSSWEKFTYNPQKITLMQRIIERASLEVNELLKRK